MTLEPKFSRAFIGYSPTGVATRIRELRADLTDDLAAKQAEEARVIDSNEQRVLDMRGLETEISRLRDREQQVERSLAQVQEEAREIEGQAQQKADEMRRATTEQLAAARAQLAELKSMLMRFKGEFDGILVKFSAGLVPVPLEEGQYVADKPEVAPTQPVQGDSSEVEAFGQT